MGIKQDVLGKNTVVLLWSQSAGITCCFSQGSFNYFEDSSPVGRKCICDPNIKLPVSSVAPLPKKKILASVLLVVFALRPYTFY